MRTKANVLYSAVRISM